MSKQELKTKISELGKEILQLEDDLKFVIHPISIKLMNKEINVHMQELKQYEMELS